MYSCHNVSNDALVICGIQCANFSILNCYCATYNESKGLIEVGQCPYNCARYRSNRLIDVIYQPMPSNMSEWNDYMCNDFKRSGTLCGACSADHNLYPRSYSFDLECIKCSDGASGWGKYLLSAYLPLTLFCLIIYLFKIDIHSSLIQRFIIIFSQILTIPANICTCYTACF